MAWFPQSAEYTIPLNLQCFTAISPPLPKLECSLLFEKMIATIFISEVRIQFLQRNLNSEQG